jgi:integrase
MTIFDTFISDYTRREKHRTALTYYKLLSQFEKWLGGRDQFDDQDVIGFLEGQKWSNTSRNIFLAAMRGWAKDAKSRIPSGATLEEIQRGREDEKRLERIINLKGYKQTRGEKPSLSLEQISTVFEAMTPEDAGLFWTLLWFGVRVGELKTVKIDWTEGKLTVETEKVGGTRSLFFDEYTRRLLRYAEEKGLLDLPEATVWKRLRKYSGFIAPIKLGPHICRHTFATHFHELTDEITLKRMLGHSHGSATEVYVHPVERIREVMLVRHYLKPLEVGRDGQ